MHVCVRAPEDRYDAYVENGRARERERDRGWESERRAQRETEGGRGRGREREGTGRARSRARRAPGVPAPPAPSQLSADAPVLQLCCTGASADDAETRAAHVPRAAFPSPDWAAALRTKSSPHLLHTEAYQHISVQKYTGIYPYRGIPEHIHIQRGVPVYICIEVYQSVSV